MGMNGVQFQKGLSLGEFFRRYGTKEGCEQAVLAWRWPEGFACPGCGQGEHTTFRRGGLLYLQCCHCRHQASLLAGTVFESSKLGLPRWFQAMYLLTQAKNGVSALELMRHLGVCYKTAWSLKHKLLQAMVVAEESRQLTGRVEIDDAYFGGERHGGKPGRGSENKVPFVAAVQTTQDGQPQYVCLKQCRFTKTALAAFIAKSMVRPLTVVSDGLVCFTTAEDAGVHDRTVTGGGKDCVALPQFKAVNTVLGNLKTSVAGTYHAFAFAKYADRYLAEFQFKFNRRFSMHELLASLTRAVIRAAPQPVRTLRLAEVCR
jgi:hypothetical protein